MIGSIGCGSGGFDMSSIKQKQQQLFNSLDTNGDGKIDKGELAALQKSRQAKGAQGGRSVDQIFGKLDTDSDGGITLQEADAGLAKLARHMTSSLQMAQGLDDLNPQLTVPGNGDDQSATPSAERMPLYTPARAALRSYGPWITRGHAKSATETASPAAPVCNS